MICPKCGATIRDGLSFCPKCGTTIIVSTQTSMDPCVHSNPYTPTTFKQEKFYQKNWFIILMLIIFFPVGLFLMWKYANWHISIKIIISVLLAFMCIYSWTNPTNTTDSQTNTIINTKQADSNPTYEFGFKDNTIVTDECTIKITDLNIIENNNEYLLDIHFDYTYKGTGTPNSATADFTKYIMVAQGTYQNDGIEKYNELGSGRSPDFLASYLNDVPKTKNKTIEAVSCFKLSNLSTPVTILCKNSTNIEKGESHTFNIENQTLILNK